MSLERKCPECGTELDDGSSEGLCLKCLLQVGAKPDQNESQISPSEAGAFRADAGMVTSSSKFPSPSTASPSLWLPAFSHFGNYELLEEIARGGMGVVYRAQQVSLGRIVAVKMLLAGPLAAKDFIQRFRTEAAAAASLQHPNIVAIHEVGFAEGQHFFAMDYVEGLTLAQLVGKGALPARRAAEYLKSIAEAIDFAHERNVLHRDLKPSNILIDSATDRPRVTDFGLAKRLEAETELTLSGQVLGSPNFMSPEQATAKRGTVGRRSDVYSLGAILYYALTGRPPFQGETLTDVLLHVVNNDPLAPRLLTPRLPRDLETICLKCLEKEPSRRYQTARELADELGRFLRDEPIEARPVSRFENAWRLCRRKPALASLCAALVLVFTLGFTGTLWQWRVATHNAQAEIKQRQVAEANGQRAEENRERVAQSLYESDMNLAQHGWNDGDLGLTLSLLEAHQPRTGETDRRGFEWFYFWNLCKGDQRMTLTNHIQSVNCVAFSPDGRRLATGSVGNPVQIWDCATGRIVQTLPEQNVVSLAFALDGRTLGVGGRDRVVVWNLESESAVFKREETLGQFRIAFPPKGTLLMIGKGGLPLFTPYNDGGSAELWDYVTGELKQVFPESGGCIAVSLRGDRLATGNTNETIKIWDLASGQLVQSLNTGWVMAMALSPDGRTLATSYWDPEVKLWDVTSGVQVGSLTNNQRRVWSLAFSPDGTFLATGGADQMVRLWDVATRQQTEQLKGHGSEVISVAFSADGQALTSGGKDKKAMLWSVHPNRAVTTNAISTAAIFSPDGRFVAAGIGQNKVAVWDVATLQEKAVFDGAHDVVAFSTDASALIARGTNYFLRFFDVATQAIRKTIPGRPAEEIDSYAVLSPDGQILAEGGLTNGTITFFDAKTGVLIAPIAPAQSSSIFKLAFSPNGKLLAAAGPAAEPSAKIWDTATHKLVAAPQGHTDLVLEVAFSPDGKTLATCSVDDSIRFWDTTYWKEIPPSLAQKEYVSALAFSPNGRILATACSDGTMKLSNVVTRRELATLKLGIYGSRIAFSPDGQTLAAWDSWGGGGSLRLWRAPVPDMKQARLRDN